MQMLADPETLRCLELISQAALDARLWTPALTAVTAMFRSEHAILFSNKASWSSWPFKATSGLDDRDLARFFAAETMHLWEPWHRAMVPGKVVPHHQVVSDAVFEETELYNDIIRPTGTFYGTCFQQDGDGLSFHLNVCRRRRVGAFSPHETQKLQTLTAHVTLALRLQHRFAVLEGRAELLSRTFDRMEDGVIVLDARGNPVVLNAAAQRHIAQQNGIARGTGGMRGGTKASTEKLRQAIARAALPMGADATRMHLPRRPPQPPLLVDILPLGQLALSSPGSTPPSVVIFLREPNEPVTLDRAAVTDFYRLTRREGDIAALLMDGMTVEMIAKRLELTQGTVRNHLKRIFEKTAVHSQVALLAVLRSFGRR
jgi:DNA-binding CsgD family transcriptional regulator/PAS domain-containing protein